jgi:PleD family two-component response regulator/glyoxylase-like metal-dependent hydrolase (beta-lactamase superfamily II)
MELVPGIHHVGSTNASTVAVDLDCHPYLLVDGTDAVLFDPGSVLDYDEVSANIIRLLGSLGKITLIVAHHQDPDICGSLPLFRKMGVTAPIALHRRTKSLVRFYGVGGSFLIVNENHWRYRLASGRVLRFLPAPYLHFAGSFMSFDETSGTLFSGDIFGAMTREPGLFAGDRYFDAMKTFHEHYMPSREILGPVMETLLGLPIKIIAPQHGRIIRGNVRAAIMILKDLPCGTYLAARTAESAVKSRRTVTWPDLVTDILNRLAAQFGVEEVRTLIPDFPFTLDEETLKVTGFNGEPSRLWNPFFEVIHRVKGTYWLTVVEPHLFRLVREYDLPIPEVVVQALMKGITLPVYNSAAQREEGTDLEKRNRSFNSVRDSLIHDTVTDLFNQRFFWSYLEGYFSDRVSPYPFALAYFSIDNLMDINRIHGRNAGDETLRSAGFFLKNAIRPGDDHSVYKLNAPVYAYFLPSVSREEARKRIESVCSDIRYSDLFLEKVTLSAGLVYGNELSRDLSGEKLIRALDQKAMAMLKGAVRQGGATICDKVDDTLTGDPDRKLVMIAETDPAFIRYLKIRLEKLGLRTLEVSDGETAWQKALVHKPDLILSEIFLPKLSGFDLRERLLSDSSLAGIPFVLISFRKSEEDIRVAALLRILFYFHKPVSAAELEGLVQNLLSPVRES